MQKVTVVDRSVTKRNQFKSSLLWKKFGKHLIDSGNDKV